MTESYVFIKKVCVKCGNLRKYVQGTERDLTGICGNCWDWGTKP